MKKILMTLMLVQGLGMSMASAEQNMTTMVADEHGTPIEIMYRSCNDPYLGWRETCESATNSCPPGYDAEGKMCCDSYMEWHRCGTICKSIYFGN